MIGGLHAVRVPSSEEEEALRDLIRARGPARRSDARAPAAGQAAAAPRRALRGHRQRLERAPPRQDGQPAHIVAICWQAQQRLHRVWRRLDGKRAKRRTIVAVAVARALAGFCSALARAD